MLTRRDKQKRDMLPTATKAATKPLKRDEKNAVKSTQKAETSGLPSSAPFSSLILPADSHPRAPRPLSDIFGKQEIKKAVGTELGEAVPIYAQYIERPTNSSRQQGSSIPPTANAGWLFALGDSSISEAEIAVAAAGRVEPVSPLREGLTIIQDELACEQERDERRGVKPPVSIEAIRALGYNQPSQAFYAINLRWTIALRRSRQARGVKYDDRYQSEFYQPHGQTELTATANTARQQ